MNGVTGPHRSPYLRLWLLSLALAAAGGPAAAEEADALSPAPAEAPAPAPAAEDVRRVIKELGSVRDYERLDWILDAVEQQVPPVRAELLKQLDDQIQQLFRAEVELRTATAVASLQQFTGTPAGMGPPPSQPTPPPPLGESSETASEARSDVPPWAVPKAYEEVEGRINTWEPPQDPKQELEQLRELSQLVLGVEGMDRRKTLHTRLQKKTAEATKARIERQQHEIQDLVPSSSSAPVEPQAGVPESEVEPSDP